MPPPVGTIVIFFLIGLLFFLDRDQKARTSKALWIPVVWLSIIASRPVTHWLETFGLVSPQPFSVDVYVDGSPTDRNVFLSLLIIGIIVLARRRPQVARLLKSNIPLLLYFAYCALSFAWSDYPSVSLKRWIKALADVAMVAIVLTDPNPSAAVKRFLARVGFLLVPLSVLFVKFYPELGRQYSQWTWQPMFVGVGAQKNSLGAICLIFGIGFAWRLVSTYQDKKGEGRTRQMAAHGIFLAMVVWLLYKSDSMTSVSCLMIGLTVIGATTFRWVNRRLFFVHVMSIALVGATFSVLFLDFSGGALEMLGRDPTLTGRTEIWDATLSLAGSPYLGTGYESFWLGERFEKVAQIVHNHFTQAHNGYLELYLNLGWIGVSLAITVMLTTYISITKVLRRDSDEARLWLAYCLIFIVYNFTEGSFKMTSPMMLIFLLATMAPARLPGTKGRIVAHAVAGARFYRPLQVARDSS
jgi:O-antigen ligase